MSIAAVLSALQAEFDGLTDSFSKYAYLVELARLLPPPDPVLRQEENAYHGCQSEVWLRPYAEDGMVRLDADSDTLIIRGVLALFREVLDGQRLSEVQRADFDLLKALGIQTYFSSVRVSGVAGLLPEIQRRLKNAL